MKYICKQCGISHNGNYSKIFCTKTCRYKYLSSLGSKKGASKTAEKYKNLRHKTLQKILQNELSPDSIKKNLKDLLFEFNLKQRQCENCKLTTWMDQDIPLQIHHIDGNHNNNLIENLQILCPNCHAQTDTYGMRNMTKKMNN